jgi:hypothetical protein
MFYLGSNSRVDSRLRGVTYRHGAFSQAPLLTLFAAGGLLVLACSGRPDKGTIPLLPPGSRFAGTSRHVVRSPHMPYFAFRWAMLRSILNTPTLPHTVINTVVLHGKGTIRLYLGTIRQYLPTVLPIKTCTKSHCTWCLRRPCLPWYNVVRQVIDR